MSNTNVIPIDLKLADLLGIPVELAARVRRAPARCTCGIEPHYLDFDMPCDWCLDWKPDSSSYDALRKQKDTVLAERWLKCPDSILLYPP